MRLGVRAIGLDRPLFDVGDWDKALNNAVEMTAQAIKVDFEVTTRTWKNRPRFRIARKAAEFSREISTNNEIYAYVNYGTRPHIIRPVNASRLAFPANYQAKTTVRQIRSRDGGGYGPTKFAQEVHHPGSAGRHFDEVIEEKWAKEWPAQLFRAISAIKFR